MKRLLLCIACLFALTFVSSKVAIIEVAPAGAWGVLGISGGGGGGGGAATGAYDPNTLIAAGSDVWDTDENTGMSITLAYIDKSPNRNLNNGRSSLQSGQPVQERRALLKRSGVGFLVIDPPRLLEW